VVGEKLTCKHDTCTREEAKLYDEFSVGIYRLSTFSSQDQELGGHLPIKLSFLLCKFLSREGSSLGIFTDRSKVSRGRACGFRAVYCFF